MTNCAMFKKKSMYSPPGCDFKHACMYITLFCTHIYKHIYYKIHVNTQNMIGAFNIFL